MLEPIFLTGTASGSGAGRWAGRRPALLCDRDGTIIEDRPAYVRSLADISLLPGAVEALRRAFDQGLTIILVSNQSAVGRGLLTCQEVIALHQALVRSIARQGVEVAGSYLCPHSDAHGCSCRKPAPGMVLAALKEFNLSRSDTFLIGDSPRDVAAAWPAGVRPLLVRTGHSAGAAALPKSPGMGSVKIADDLSAAVDFILADLRVGRE
jgi:D-glycero-D-manno-heptose 1,7-bisphosphate phosphatase